MQNHHYLVESMQQGQSSWDCISYQWDHIFRGDWRYCNFSNVQL